MILILLRIELQHSRRKTDSDSFLEGTTNPEGTKSSFIANFIVTIDFYQAVSLRYNNTFSKRCARSTITL